jgi:endonuclease/exonuclease/phosphatase family metal-dependent hydrolase
MKPVLSFLILLSFILSAYAQNDRITVMTYNIRCGSCESEQDINHWSKRKFLVAWLIKTKQPDIISLQEAELSQVNDLVELLNDYLRVGVGREDGATKGESNSVLYKKNRFSLSESKTLWLSETPDKVSKGWDAACNRTLTILKLNDLNTQKVFYIFNTHFDHMGLEARKHSVQLVLSEIAKVSSAFPVILTGDFNFNPNDPNYKTLTDKLNDTEYHAEKSNIPVNYTFNGFGKTTEPGKIDFIFTTSHVKTIEYIGDNTSFKGIYPSDHFPVTVVIGF